MLLILLSMQLSLRSIFEMKKRVKKEGVCCSRGAATPFIDTNLTQEEAFIVDRLSMWLDKE